MSLELTNGSSSRSLSKANLVASVDSEVERMKFGLKVEGEDIAYCSNCDQPLVLFLLLNRRITKQTLISEYGFVEARVPVEEHPELKFRVNCPFCGDKSFLKRFNKAVRIAPANGVVISEYQYNDNVITIETVRE